jgi:NifU-like protein involved in Fe-S cluster formation
MEHFMAPRNTGRMEAPDRVGQAGGPGQAMFFVLHLRLSGGLVAEAKYQTYGCGATIAAGSMLTVMITNRSVEECLALTAEDLTRVLGGLPAEKMHCPGMVIGALREALMKN